MSTKAGKASDALKIIVIGPKGCGKTTVANYVSGFSTTLGEYHPTIGIRCLEFDRDRLTVTDPKKRTSVTVKCAVELWDVSGDTRFASCWPAIAQDCDGVLMVFNPDEKGQEKDIEMWFKTFVLNKNLKHDTQCALFAHRSSPGDRVSKIKISKNLVKVPIAQTSVDYEAETITTEFDKLLANCYLQRRESEESAILA